MPTYLFRRALAGVLFFALSLSAWAQTFSADTPVLAAPDAAAKVVANVKSGAPAKVVKRQGFWLEIESGPTKGWVRISTVKLATATGPGAIDTGRLGTGNIVATSSARGLSAKDLLDGKSDEKAVDKLNAHKPDTRQVLQFAQEGGLAEIKLTAFLKAPVAEVPAARVESGTARDSSEGATSGSRARRGRKGSDDDM